MRTIYVRAIIHNRIGFIHSFIFRICSSQNYIEQQQTAPLINLLKNILLSDF